MRLISHLYIIMINRYDAFNSDINASLVWMPLKSFIEFDLDGNNVQLFLQKYLLYCSQNNIFKDVYAKLYIGIVRPNSYTLIYGYTYGLSYNPYSSFIMVGLNVAVAFGYDNNGWYYNSLL